MLIQSLKYARYYFKVSNLLSYYYCIYFNVRLHCLNMGIVFIWA